MIFISGDRTPLECGGRCATYPMSNCRPKPEFDLSPPPWHRQNDPPWRFERYIYGLRNVVLTTVLQGTNSAGGLFQPFERTQLRIAEPSAGWAIRNP